MNRNGLIVLLVAIAAIAVVLATGCGGSSDSQDSASGSGKSPACLPATLNHSAKLEGTPIDVSPAPETDTANPDTQISFLGVPAAEVRQVSVVGRRSGDHPGHLGVYSQGDGASFVPDSPFDAGEQVMVRAVIGTGQSQSSGNVGSSGNGVGGGKSIAFQFRVATPYSTATTPAFPNPQAAPADYQSFYTMPGVQAPVLTVTMPDRDPAAGDILTTNGPGPGQYGPLIYTPQGRLVWFDRLSGGEAAEDLNEQTYAGRRVLTWWKGKVLSLGFGQGEDIVTSSSYQTVARIPGGNGLHADLHDFQIAPRDIAYITAFNPIRCNLSAEKGSPAGAIVDTAIQEIDMRTGLVRWEWHSLDHVGVAESEVQTPTDATPWDWFHINSIDVEGGDSNQPVTSSSRPAAPGPATSWKAAAARCSGASVATGAPSGWAQARGRPGSTTGACSQTARSASSTTARTRRSTASRAASGSRSTSRLTKRASSPPTHTQALRCSSPSQGNMQTLADGNAVVGYGGVPAISEYAAAGALLLDAHLPFDMSFYRAFRFPWSGRPLSPPAVLAGLNDTGEETIVHASWNGATGVASWRVLAAKASGGALTAQATIPASGFESSTTLPEKYARVAVQALDSTGHPLGTSRTVQPISYAASLR